MLRSSCGLPPAARANSRTPLTGGSWKKSPTRMTAIPPEGERQARRQAQAPLHQRQLRCSEHRHLVNEQAVHAREELLQRGDVVLHQLRLVQEAETFLRTEALP
ncbi:hypothetical protein DIPPA_28014 [Diplonema papillatum]|nr:hypothetical protein DIPPA_28014 [Diplonema papillatum]